MLVAMSTRLMLTRPWLYGLFNGVVGGLLYGLVMAAQKRLSHPDQYSWSEAAIESVVLGAIFGTLIGVSFGWLQRRHRHDPGRDELRALAPRDQTIAVRAVYRGPVPADPAARDVSLRLAGHLLARTNEQRPLRYAFVGLMVSSSRTARCRPHSS